ncbi:uncharacterized protein LOC144457681 [Phascolarctos cinereus]
MQDSFENKECLPGGPASKTRRRSTFLLYGTSSFSRLTSQDIRFLLRGWLTRSLAQSRKLLLPSLRVPSPRPPSPRRWLRSDRARHAGLTPPSPPEEPLPFPRAFITANWKYQVPDLWMRILFPFSSFLQCLCLAVRSPGYKIS